MGLSIKDPDTESVVRELARLKKMSLTDAVRIAVENELQRTRHDIPLVERLRAIGDRLAAQSTPTGMKADKAFFDQLGGE